VVSIEEEWPVGLAKRWVNNVHYERERERSAVHSIDTVRRKGGVKGRELNFVRGPADGTYYGHCSLRVRLAQKTWMPGM
jgi:hypothetical protein